MKWSTTSPPASFKLNDSSPMPWGIHKGKPMAQLPVEYLHALWQQGGLKNQPADSVSIYIKGCLSALKKENGDLLWS